MKLRSATCAGSAHDIYVGNDVLVSFDVLAMDHDGHSLNFEYRARDVQEWSQARKDRTQVERGAIWIQDKFWVRARATIRKGVTVGEGVVVASATVVTKDVERGLSSRATRLVQSGLSER